MSEPLATSHHPQALLQMSGIVKQFPKRFR